MSFGVSAGAYGAIEDRSFIVSGTGLLSGGIVISSKRGSTDVNLVTNAEQFVEQYGYPSRDNPSMYAAMRFLRRAGFLNVVRVINDAESASGALMDGETTPSEELSITAANEGAWGNNVTVNIEDSTRLPADVFFLIVLENDVEVERFEVSRDINAVNGFGKSIYIEDVVNGNSNFITVSDTPNTSLTYVETTVDLAGGTDDTTAPTAAMISTAWDKFLNVEDVDAKLLINAGWATPEVQTKMLSVAEQRRDAFAILDVPQSDNADPQAMVTYRNDTLAADTYHGALYGGWIKMLDQNSGFRIEVPASGDVAANFVESLQNGYIWDPVMGLQNGSVPNTLGTTKNFTEGERDLLYQNGINPVTKIGVNNAVIWGQKTLQQFASGLDRVNVVMNVKDMDVAITRALLPYVGKPNTVTYRNSAGGIVERFLETRKRQGGLYDYFVDYSDAINTPAIIDQQQFLINEFVQPVKAMEFIKNTLVVTQTGVDLG